MRDRDALIEYLRGELVGPARPLLQPEVIHFQERLFSDAIPLRRGPISWLPAADQPHEEVLYHDRETPHRKYGAGLLHPEGAGFDTRQDLTAADATDTLGVDTPPQADEPETEESEENSDDARAELTAGTDELDVTSPDVRHPSSIGISYCVRVAKGGQVTLRMPRYRRFRWQAEKAQPFEVNGRYEECVRRWIDEKGMREAPIWRRRPAVSQEAVVSINAGELTAGKVIRRIVPMAAGTAIVLRCEFFCRPLKGQKDSWLITTVLRNRTPRDAAPVQECTLYQVYFEVSVNGGELLRYPESERPFASLDADEQSLALLYRESATWAVGHGCAAGWDSSPSESPECVYADVMPGVELPSMTPDIEDSEGNRITLSMRALSAITIDAANEGWSSIARLLNEYALWIERRRSDADAIQHDGHRQVAHAHLAQCEECLARMRAGAELLRTDIDVRTAFGMANLAMLLQQIATKRLRRRGLTWDAMSQRPAPSGQRQSPWDIYSSNTEGDLGRWRAFQIAFLLMQLADVSDGTSPHRDVVDLIWFPTGGGKTEAYLGVMAFLMFYERLRMKRGHGLRRDGTNVIMRYTLRMLTTQQFQRAASLVCAMEFLRRYPEKHGFGEIAGQRFSLGLWLGRDGSPNDVASAKTQLNEYRAEKAAGNPLILTECPWCRAEIGRYDGTRPKSVKDKEFKAVRVAGIAEVNPEGPLLLCPDARCEFGRQSWLEWLPVEVIDERIYRQPPSLVIATADKFAMLAYRPKAGAIFGRTEREGEIVQEFHSPSLIIQDELHLIAGPLGTLYGLYECMIERLCSAETAEGLIKPKIIASTATIRGAADQTKALYARTEQRTGEAMVRLFPSPGLLMGDSFFGVYAKDKSTGQLLPGRLYIGIHANDYGSVLTTQVRTFAGALSKTAALSPASRDPWWTLLVFYNSLRELGGAKTLFDSDIRSRLKFLQNREAVPMADRRNLRMVEELTSRLSQSEIVGMLDGLATEYSEEGNKAFDACLASSIIEVGVDIDRLSLMSVVGQPKTTSQYIQVTGRVGRRWWERPGLILTIYNAAKSRDRSHFEQFHSYHRRLYERVEPTSATPFALSAIQRGMAGAILTWARQQSAADVQQVSAYRRAVDAAYSFLRGRCSTVQVAEDVERSLGELEREWNDLLEKWARNPQKWEAFPPSVDGEYLMLWPGQFSTPLQRQNGVEVPSNMRQVDGSAELAITQTYALTTAKPNAD